MHTYCKLKNGDVVIIWSNNIEEKTILAYPIEQEDEFDIEWDYLTEYKYSEVDRTDTNLSNL